MYKKSLFSVTVAAMLAATAGQARADLVVTTGLTADQLVQALLAGSSGITTSNATLVGLADMSGTFTGGDSASLGFDSGIILTSGVAGQASLASGQSLLGMNENREQPGDAALSAIVGASTFDASVLTFDFVPTGDHVQFSYVFASTEYNTYVGSQFNDVFAFFVNGVNYALVPGTSTPVSISNVNCGQSSYQAPGAGTNCDKFRDNKFATGYVGASALINHGGLTQVFSFVAPVNAGVTNTMYLAIADTSDPILDSSVFIQAGSFSVCGAPGQPSCGGNGNAVPEPASLALMGMALAGVGMARRRRR